MRRKLNRLLALLLCALMLSSEFTGLLTAAQAAPAAPAQTAALSETPQSPETPEVPAGGMSEAELLAAIPSTDNGSLDFEDDMKIRPNLFVHFLGDNYHYKTDQNSGATLGQLPPIPAAYDQSRESNPTATGNTWARYRSSNGDMVDTESFGGQVIFWVGLGVDRREVFELLQKDSQGKSGLTSLEAGFYYDSAYIEPYYGPTQLTDDADIQAAYRQVITEANIKSDTTPADYPANALWSADYEILRAETDMDPVTDPITREEVTRPSFDEIVGGPISSFPESKWRMTYVSLELKDPGDDTAQRRLAEAYTGAAEGDDGSRTVPEAAQGTGLEADETQAESDYQYLLLIPFRLKRYNAYPNQHTLRLVRDATHLSIGAGAEGEERYAAWERITTRNPGKDLKLLTRFNGDLYLFGEPTGNDRGEVPYTATLYIDENPSVMNTVELAVDGDPAVWPVKATANQQQITGLHSGLGMVVRTDPAPGYTVTLTVKYHGADGTSYIIHPYTVVTANREYTFTMPQVPAMVKDVEVHIGFTTDNPQYHVFLSELTRDEHGDFTDAAVLGNSATVTTNLDAATGAATGNTHTIHSYDPPYEPHPNHLPAYSLNPHADHPGPMAQADVGKRVQIDVATHHDYQAVVRVGQFDTTGTLVTNWISIDGRNYTRSPSGDTITLPYGGTITLYMVGADLDVEIVYQPAARYKATLEVYHDTGVEVTDQNTAQLAYLVYDQNDESTTAYSGVVYHQKTDEAEDHRAVKGDGGNKKLPWIAASQATLSGSLAGDAGREPRGWNPGPLDPDIPSALCRDAVMSQLKSAASLAAFATSLSALDLNAQEVIPGWTGLRKDLQGQSYGDGDVAQFKGYLWELKTRISRDTALTQLYDKTVTDPADGSTLYSYLDLTTAQVQAYILDILRSQEIDRANQRQYDEAYQKYLVVQAKRETLAADPILSGMAALEAPIRPDRNLVVTDGVRTFQGEDYQYAEDQSGNYLNQYYAYLESYETYLDEVGEKGTLNGVTAPAAAPAAAALQEIPLRTHDQAVTMLTDYLSAFQTANPVSSSPTIETREERTVWVVLEGDSAYYVKSVQLFEVNGSNESTVLITNITPTQDPDYANVWSFTMPSRNCAVRVTYARRNTRNLMVQIVGANGEEENVASVAAYRFYDHDPDHYPDELTGRTTPVLDKITNLDHQSESPYPPAPAPDSGEADERYIYNVFIDGTVTVRVKAKEGYTTQVMVENVSRGDSRYLTKGTTLDPREGDLYTFKVEDTGYENDLLRVTVTYIQQRDQYNAHIRAYPVPGEDAALGNDAQWRIENPGPPPSVNHAIDMPAYVGDHLVGDITVAPGYYIYGIAARGASGSYSFTYTGNGYNNGYGAGEDDPVKVYVDMPDEELWVEVYFKKVTEDAPESEPHYALTLTAKDPDNSKTPYAANYATATVYQRDADGSSDGDSPVDFTLGPVGLASGHGDGAMTQTSFARTGQWVRVEANVAEGYCLSKVTVGPGDLGVAVTWESESSVSFYMPAGSVGVCVEFAKLGEGEHPPAHVLTVRETWDSTSPVTADVQGKNYVRTAASGTIQEWNYGPVILVSSSNPERIPGADAGETARGAAESGEEVTLIYQVDDGNDWYIQSIILFSEGAATRLTDLAQEVAANPYPGETSFPYPAPAGKYYQVTFRMPSSDAEFVIHYRQADDAHTSYPLTMVLYDPDNVAETKDDNRLSATFSGFAGVTHPGVTLGQALGTPLMNDVRYLHPGDQVTLETQLQEGYAVDYLIIDPASLGLYPAWQSTSYDPATGVTKSTATFTMPNEGVAVLARYVKGSPHRYTANLILHPPAGYKMDDVGQGTFSTAGGGPVGSLTDYHKNAVYSTTQVPGTAVGYDLYAYDGFYIQRVTIEPAAGSTAGLSGSTGYQDGSFLMPAANVNINVYFQKGWPDEIQYDLTLEVQDPASTGSYAAFRSVGANALTAPDSDAVHGGQSKTLQSAAYDNDVVVVDVTPVETGYYNSGAVSVTDSDGNALVWWYVPGGIAFTMPPRSTKVVITFKDQEDDPDDWPLHKATLVVLGGAESDYAKLEADSTTATDNPATYSYNSSTSWSQSVGDLHTQDLLTLTAQPGADRHIDAVYAVYTVGGDTYTVPIYQTDADGHLAAPPVEAGFTPGTPGDLTQAVSGLLAMPNADVTVYVRFAAGAIDPSRKWISLKVSGAEGSGLATADFDGNNAIPAMTVYPPTATGLPPLLAAAGAAAGMDTRFTSQGQEVTVTFAPATGYDIIKLEVYDAAGRAVPYQWLSVTQSPSTLTDTNTWPNPPTDPDPGIGHPGWVGTGTRAIQLTVPEGCVTVHVTYGRVSDQPFRVQVVVNDPYPATPADPSQNNAWVIDPADQLKKKLREAKAGDWITIDLSVHPGYQVEYIKVIPQSYGLAPTLPLPPIYSQSTGFYMPNGDCTVYVKFTRDTTATKIATVVAVGEPTNNPTANYATIQSPLNTAQLHAPVGGSTRFVPARPTVDWITVDYYWAANASVQSVVVQTQDGTDVPYTQTLNETGHGRITLPMPLKDLLVTVIYQASAQPPGQEVVLHVIDKDQRADPTSPPIRLEHNGNEVNYGRLQAVYNVSVDTGLIGPDSPPAETEYEGVSTIWVPAGEQVNVFANSDYPDGVSIDAAFVLYEAGGQMLNMNLQPDTTSPGFSGQDGEKQSSFVVHQGRNDVYVLLTRKAPARTEYAAVLMLRGPEDDSGQAGIAVGPSYTGAEPDRYGRLRRDGLPQANQGYAYVTAAQGEGITVNVVPAAGYAIDYVQVTPLGYPLSYDLRSADNTITFDMPHCNVAITVYLKRATQGEHPLYLHYRSVEPDAADPVQKADYARLDWTTDSGAAETIWAWDEDNKTNGVAPPGSDSNLWGPDEMRMVTAGTSVTLWATLDDPDLILAAYVLSGGDLVPLTPTFPGNLDQNTGLEGVRESASNGDNTQADALATFEMPNGETHVYLVTTNQKPYDQWHTVILTASDTSSAGNDLGKNKGFLNTLGDPEDKEQTVYSFGGVDGPDGEPGHAFLTLPEYKADGVTLNYFTVGTEPAPGYTVNRFKTRTVKNTPVYVQNPTPTSVTPNYYYEEPVGSCNKVFRLVFESAEDLELVVQIDDPDNPGNGTVENKLVASHTGVPDLALASESMAGSYQIMTGVTPGGAVGLAVTPHTGYKAYAFLYTDGALQPTQVPLSDPDGDGVWNGTFDMPGNKARVVVTFYLPYQGTLVLVDNANANAQARMTESTQTAPASVSVSQLKTADTLYDLPNGTLLDAQVTAPVDLVGRKVTGLLTTGGSTTLLPAQDEDGVDHYRHTIDRADATITLVIDEKSLTGEEAYVAAVETVNKPSDVAAPTIANQTDDTKSKGDIWTSADQNDNIQVHVTVPEGYTVRVTAQQADDGSAVTLTGVADGGSLAYTGEVTFSMPAANVQVTVEYLRTHYRLTLHITQPDGTSNVTHLTATSVLDGNSADLTTDGAWTYAQMRTDVNLTATADTAQDVILKRVFYQYSDGTYENVTLSGDSYDSAPLLLTMPEADVDVTVIYARKWEPGPDPTPEPDPDDYFIATAVKALGDHTADHPDNQILSIQNRTRTAKTDGSPLPQASPVWTAGYAGDAVQVAYQAAPGYAVTVTARRADNNDSLPVLQMGYSLSGTATAAFPDPGVDIVITVRFDADVLPPHQEAHDAALQLVEHDGKKGNWAQTTDYPGDILRRKDVPGDPLALDGTHPEHPPTYTAPLPTDPVEMLGSETYAGDDLRTLAKWAADSSVTRMTVAVRNTATNAETGEVDLPLTYYAGTVTSRAQTPVLGENEIAVLRVYYGNLYQATLHVVGAGAGDVTEATDDRPDTITSVEGSDKIHNSDERLEDLRGGEIVQTTAKPDTEGASGEKKRLVGVVYESDSLGAWPAQPNEDVDDRYDFTMPQDNVDFYVVYEEEPEDPKDRSYIAKVQLDASSAPIAGTDNALSIRNDNDADVAKGKYWVAAKGGDSVTVNVKAAPGYQAQILYTKADDTSDTVLHQLPQVPDPDTGALRYVQPGDDFHYYISRTQFIANLPEGKDATFTMPADTDATVTVKFTKGYDLSLSVTDATGLTAEDDGTNQVELTYDDDPEARLSWTNDGTDQTYDPTDHTLEALEGGKNVETAVTPYDTGVKVKVTRTTPSTGTVTLTDDTSDYPFLMPREDTQVSVLLQDADAPDDLLAKVELVGDYADINGNAAAPIVVDDDDHADPAVSHSAGQVWTTTCQGDQLDVTLTVARGYVARIKVRRDNENYTKNPNDPTRWDYLDSETYEFEKTWQESDGSVPPGSLNTGSVSLGASGVNEVQIGYNAAAMPLSPFPQSIGGPQHFRFTMVSDIPDGEPACDVTVLVEFVRSTEMPRPFDPDNQAMSKIDLARGFIYGENRGDYAIIEIPTLAEVGETATTLYDTDNWDADHISTPPKIHDPSKAAEYDVTRYIFALYDPASDTYRELVATGDNADVMLVPYDEKTLADGKDLYNYILGLYHGSETLDGAENQRDFVGSKLLLLPKPKADGTFTQRGQALYEMLNNKGSLACQADGTPAKNADGKYYTTLYVMAEDAGKRQSGYTPVWIRPWFALGVNVISYGPTHPLTGELYRLMTQAELDKVKGVATPSTSQTLLSPDDFTSYQYNSKQAPFLTDSIVLENDAGSGKWLQLLRIRSSELLGGFAADYDPGKTDLLDNVPAGENLTYALALRKAANLTYRRVNLELNPKADCYNKPDGPKLADYYLNKDPATRTFIIQDTIQLITGDVDGNRMVKLQDYDLAYDYVYRNSAWNTVPAVPVQPSTPQSSAGPEWDAYYAAKGEWSISVYNPASTAYRVDLDGDRRLTVADLDIVRTLYNYNRAEADYQWRQVNSAGKGIALVLPFGLGPRPSDHMLLLGLPLEGEMPADPYWDQSADLDSQEAEALDTLWVDRDGNLWQGAADPEDGDAADTAERPAQPQPQPGERVEIPLGGDQQGQAGQPQGDREVFWEPAFPAEDMTPSPEPTDETPEADPEDEAAPEDPLPEREAEPESEAEAQPETPPSEADATPETPPSEPEATPETPLSQAVPDSAPES